MRSELVRKIEELFNEPYIDEDMQFVTFFVKSSRVILIIRYLYMKLPLLLKLLVGVPLYWFKVELLVIYLLFVVGSVILDRFFRYDFSNAQFSFGKYFKTYLIKNIMFVIVACFMYRFYHYGLGFVCFLYACPMSLIAFAYVVPNFDKRIYSLK